MATKATWKEHLLKSGIPLEFEIKKYLDSKGCISNFEHTYLRNNEAKIPTEFSFDIDSAFIVNRHFANLMIECKYRHESTKWVFIPETYDGPDEIYHTSFMHKNAHFNTKREFEPSFPIRFAPLCSKGIELTSEGPNPKTINQAINQLSYAMSGQIVNGMEHQVDGVLRENFGNAIFYNIPIIVTTAELYRIRENVDINTIKSAEDIRDISINEPFLIVKALPGVDLEAYNNNTFQAFIDSYGKDILEKSLNSFNNDLDFVLSVIAKNYSPSCVAVIHYSKDKNGLEGLFAFMDRVFNPDEEIITLLAQKKESIKLFLKDFGKSNKGE